MGVVDLPSMPLGLVWFSQKDVACINYSGSFPRETLTDFSWKKFKIPYYDLIDSHPYNPKIVLMHICRLTSGYNRSNMWMKVIRLKV